MRRATPVLTLTLTAALALAIPATAGPAKTYTGKATSTDGKFKYGKVTVKTKGASVTLVKIQAVTTSGCGGFMDVVFAPSDKETQITKGSATLRAGKLSVTYRPLRSVEEQTTTLLATIKGGKVTGTFKSAPLCGNAGRFTAKG